MKTAKCKRGLITLLTGSVLFFSACGGSVEGKETPMPEESVTSTPKEAITSTMESLKILDLDTFNECTDNYVGTHRNWLGITTREEYRVFNELLQPEATKRKRYESDYELAQEIVESMTWEIKEIEENNGKASISMEITNRDMLRAAGNYEISVWENMIESDGTGIGSLMMDMSGLLADNSGLVAAIDSLKEDDIVTMGITVSAFWEDGAWKIHVSEEFINAFMGNMNAEEYPEDVKEKIAALEEVYERKMDKWQYNF